MALITGHEDARNYEHFVPLRLRERTRNWRIFSLHLFVAQANASEHRPRNVWLFEWIYCPSGRKVLQVKYNN
jgi:hypothetical protein